MRYFDFLRELPEDVISDMIFTKVAFPEIAETLNTNKFVDED